MDQKNIASETAIVGQNCGIVGPIQECLGCSSASTLDPASCGCTWGGSRWMVVWFPGSSCPYNDGAPGSGSAAIWEVNSSMEDPSVSLCHSSQINKTSAATERRRPFAKRGRQQSFLGEKIGRASCSLLALLDPSALFYSLNPVPRLSSNEMASYKVFPLKSRIQAACCAPFNFCLNLCVGDASFPSNISPYATASQSPRGALSVCYMRQDRLQTLCWSSV